MRCIAIAIALTYVLVTALPAGAVHGSEELELRLVSTRRTQLCGEPSDVRLFLVNGGAAKVYVDRAFLGPLHIEMEMKGEWVECAQTQLAILPGVRAMAQWQQIEPGAELLIGVGGFWCPRDAGPVSRGRDWREIPGDYKLRVEASHRIDPVDLERTGPAPAGAGDWTLRSRIVDVSVEEPTGVDAEAFRWAKEHGHAPVSVEVANEFPSSYYAAFLTWQLLLTIRDSDPEYVKGGIEKGQYPPWRSVPDPTGSNGWRSVSKGEDMARWRIEQGERLLREHPDFPYGRDVRLSVAVSYAVLAQREHATRLLRALAGEKGSPEGQWAERFLALQGW